MNKLEKLVSTHELKTESSCIPWALELLLKYHGKILPDDYPLQTQATAFGFGPAEIALLQTRWDLKIDSLHCAGAFDLLAKTISVGHLIDKQAVFTIPTDFFLDLDTVSVRYVCHTFTAFSENGDLTFLTKKFAGQQVLRFTRQQISDVHTDWDLLTKPVPAVRASLLNTLFSTP